MYFLKQITEDFQDQADDLSNYWHLYFIRFLVIFWFLIFPCVFGFLMIFFREINKSKTSVILFKQFKPLMFYDYVFHNFLFFFVFLSLTFNFCFFIYTLVDVYLLELNDLYAWVWHIQIGEGPEAKEERFFFSIVCIGLILHVFATLPYIYFNLYETDSYFAEEWRRYVLKKVKTSAFLALLRNKRPALYKRLDSLFLSARIHDPKHDQKNMIVIDPHQSGI